MAAGTDCTLLQGANTYSAWYSSSANRCKEQKQVCLESTCSNAIGIMARSCQEHYMTIVRRTSLFQEKKKTYFHWAASNDPDNSGRLWPNAIHCAIQ